MRYASTITGAALWVAGSAALFAMFGLLERRAVNVVNYGLTDVEAAPAWLTFWAPGVAIVALLALFGCLMGMQGVIFSFLM